MSLKKGGFHPWIASLCSKSICILPSGTFGLQYITVKQSTIHTLTGPFTCPNKHIVLQLCVVAQRRCNIDKMSWAYLTAQGCQNILRNSARWTNFPDIIDETVERKALSTSDVQQDVKVNKQFPHADRQSFTVCCQAELIMNVCSSWLCSHLMRPPLLGTSHTAFLLSYQKAFTVLTNGL